MIYIPDILKSITKLLYADDLVKLARLNKEHLSILYNNEIWKHRVWNTGISKKMTMTMLFNNPLFDYWQYQKYCIYYYLYFLETKIYKNKLMTLKAICHTTQSQIDAYVLFQKEYYIIDYQQDCNVLYKIKTFYHKFINLLIQQPDHILDNVLVYDLYFREFYYEDYHVIIKNNMVVINNQHMPEYYLNNIQNSDIPLEKIIMLFVQVYNL
jgi:hypothetical protein